MTKYLALAALLFTAAPAYAVRAVIGECPTNSTLHRYQTTQRAICLTNDYAITDTTITVLYNYSAVAVFAHAADAQPHVVYPGCTVDYLAQSLNRATFEVHCDALTPIPASLTWRPFITFNAFPIGIGGEYITSSAAGTRFGTVIVFHQYSVPNSLIVVQ